MDVKVLDQKAIEQIRSSAGIHGVAHCVTELVLNSYDAKATAIAVRVNLSTFTIQVVDNGKGMSRENLERVGQQYMTSKCHSLSDLRSRLKYYGYRGESIWSICSVSKRVKIVTRMRGCDETYSKVMEGSSTKVDMVDMRSSFGTTVTIEGFLEKLPVRQRCIKQNDIGNIKCSLEGLILIRPQISVSLRDDVTMKVVLQNQQCEDVPTALVKIYPDIDPEGFRFRSCIKGKTCVEAMFHKELNTTKKIQYIYVNKRPVVCAKIQNQITAYFKKYNTEKTNTKKHPVFVMHIKCPYGEVDYQFNPTKTMVIFKKHENVTRCIIKILEKFLGEDLSLPEKQLTKLSSECGVSQINGAIQVKGIKRKASSAQDEEEESTQKTSKIEVIETPVVEHFAVPKTAPILPIAIQKRNEWAARIDYPEECAENEHDPGQERHDPGQEIHDPEQEIDDLEQEIDEPEMPQENITDMTFFTHNPNNERTGKALIMDMFIKSSLLTPARTIYPNKTGSATSSSPKKMISVGVQTDQFSKACHCGSRLDATEPMFDLRNKRRKPSGTLVRTEPLENVRFASTPKRNELPRQSIMKIRSKLSLEKHASSTSFGSDHVDSPAREEKNKILEELRIRKINLKKIIMTPSLHKFRFKSDANETISKYFTPFKKPESFKRVPTKEIIETTDLFARMSSQGGDDPNETTSKYFKTSNAHSFSRGNSMDSDDIKSTLTMDPLPSKLQRKATPYPVFKNKPDETVSKYFTQSQQSQYFEDVIDETPDLFVPDLTGIKSNKDDDTKIIVTLDDESRRQVLKRDFQFQQDAVKPFDTPAGNSGFSFNIGKAVSEMIQRMDDDGGDGQQNGGIDDQPVWMREVDDYGVKVYTNRISGIKMLNTPKEDWNFSFKPRISHVPKGMSPILTDGGKIEDLSPNSRNILQNAIVQSYDDELLLIKWQNCIDNQDPKLFFEQIYEEKSKQFECDIPNIKKSKWVKHSDRILGGRIFTKEFLKNLQVVGQVDRKFIAAFNERTKLLLLFDQHAVHERIRVESYKFSSTKLAQNVTMFLPRDDLVLIRNQKFALNGLGLVYETITDGIIISTVPTCVFNRCKKKKNLVSASAEILIKEVLNSLRENNGVLACTPSTIQNIVNSEACRGAIKFGDLLSKDVCCNLLRSLSDCRLPFQCAHGRPTLTPLISLDKEVVTVVKPNFKKLHVLI